MNNGIEKDELSAWDEEDAILSPLLQAAEDSKNSNLATIRSIAMKVLSEPGLFAGYNQINAILQPSLMSNGGGVNTEGEKISRSLDLFSYGTVTDYEDSPSLYLDLTGAQLNKLRQLTVLSVIQKSCVNGFRDKRNAEDTAGKRSGPAQSAALIPYKDFEVALKLVSQEETNSPKSRQRNEVEEILISCLYMGVFHGKLCQQSRSLHLSALHTIRGRDVPPSHIKAMVDRIRAIQVSLQDATSNLDTKKQHATEEIQAITAFWQQAEERRRKSESTCTSAASSMTRWDADVSPFGLEASGVVGGNPRRQKRGRAAAGAAGDPAAVFARFQA